MNTLTTIPETKIAVGTKVYFEDENYQGNGKIHYIPTEKEFEFHLECYGEKLISIKTKNNRPRFIPISQIVIL